MTEVVPVSSSAHLTLLPWLLGWPAAPDRTTFAAGLHAGSCVGIALAMPRPALRTAVLAGATCPPAAVAGLLAADAVEARLGRPAQVAALLALAGIGLGIADRSQQAREVGPPEAAWAGLAQVAALAPGVSRSGAALTALRLAGVQRTDAVQFSLLMSLPITAGAAALTLARADRDLLRSVLPPLAVATPVAAGAAFVTTRLLARRGGHALFRYSIYRLGLAVIIAAVARARAKRPDEEPR